MRMKYTEPHMEVKEFERENIVVTNSTTGEQVVKGQMGNGVTTHTEDWTTAIAGFNE